MWVQNGQRVEYEDRQCEYIVDTELFIIVVVVLYVHDSFTGSFERSATPYSDTFVHRLSAVSISLKE